jgi:hypothetical protein
MPEISRFFGIIIRMFVEAGGQHHTAHFHAYYQEEERELVAKLEDMLHSALEHPFWQEWRSKIAPTCFRYREGDQWTASAPRSKSATNRKSRTTRSRSRSIGWSANSSSKVRVRFQGRNAKTDELGAAALSDIFLFIRKYRLKPLTVLAVSTTGILGREWRPFAQQAAIAGDWML